MDIARELSYFFVASFGLWVAAFALHVAFRRRLRGRHTAEWSRLGLRGVTFESSWSNSIRFTKYLWTNGFEALDDSRLSLLGRSLKVATVSFGGSFLALIAAMLTTGGASRAASDAGDELGAPLPGVRLGMSMAEIRESRPLSTTGDSCGCQADPLASRCLTERIDTASSTWSHADYCFEGQSLLEIVLTRTWSASPSALETESVTQVAAREAIDRWGRAQEIRIWRSPPDVQPSTAAVLIRWQIESTRVELWVSGVRRESNEDGEASAERPRLELRILPNFLGERPGVGPVVLAADKQVQDMLPRGTLDLLLRRDRASAK